MDIVRISAPARLHLGFVGLNGESASEKGAFGLAIDQPVTRVEATTSSRWAISGKRKEKVDALVTTLRHSRTLQVPVELSISDVIPSHVGLGSGTQLALAIAKACTLVNETNVPEEYLSNLLGRGARSGIGTAAFSQGGFIVDKNARKFNESRAVAERFNFPQNWHIILVMNKRRQGIFGAQETRVFKELGGFSSQFTAQLQQELTGQLLPALQSQDFGPFAQAVTTIQKQVGDFFSSVQGGRFLSVQVSEILNYALRNERVAVGQSSWGPTGFIIVENKSRAQNLFRKLQQFEASDHIHFKFCSARNSGASITIEQISEDLSQAGLRESAVTR